ncbi:hypothetical protein [Prochlorococcus marinus]|uniref:Uncharacterized protein n=1 Tax=Prochlorococcus marinus (strain MIT 9303) TaxID=59922 RepID=A2C8T4_PROM3|nr:hypothetical protein [Prochlorococcus marinus]ABM77894.1 Hypothetical protein P9303_11451 [Prochlorococcus marinus str. MIT 9303]
MFKGYLRFIDVLGRSYLDRQLMGELAVLKTRSMDPDVDDIRERCKRLQKMAGGPRQSSGEGRFNPSAPRPVVESQGFGFCARSSFKISFCLAAASL